MASINIDIDTDEFEDAELIDELRSRGYVVSGNPHNDNPGKKAESNIKQIIQEMRDLNVPEDILDQIREHFWISLIPDDIKDLLKNKPIN